MKVGYSGSRHRDRSEAKFLLMEYADELEPSERLEIVILRTESAPAIITAGDHVTDVRRFFQFSVFLAMARQDTF